MLSLEQLQQYSTRQLWIVWCRSAPRESIPDAIVITRPAKTPDFASWKIQPNKKSVFPEYVTNDVNLITFRNMCLRNQSITSKQIIRQMLLWKFWNSVSDFAEYITLYRFRTMLRVYRNSRFIVLFPVFAEEHLKIFFAFDLFVINIRCWGVWQVWHITLGISFIAFISWMKASLVTQCLPTHW